MLKCVRQILVTLTVHTSLLKYLLLKQLIETLKKLNKSKKNNFISDFFKEGLLIG